MKENYYYLEQTSEIASNKNALLQADWQRFCQLLCYESIEIKQNNDQKRQNKAVICRVKMKGEYSSTLFMQILGEGELQLTLEQFSQPSGLEHFLTQFFALIDYQQQVNAKLSKKALIQFHSRYKYLLMAYSQVAYRELGRYMANIPNSLPLLQFAEQYQKALMKALSIPATREGHTNALMHMAGYFKRALSAEQKQLLTQEILSYRQGKTSLSAPLSRLKNYLAFYPDNYLLSQRYFSPYPAVFDDLRAQF